METKLIEIRDRATFIPAIAVALTVEEERNGHGWGAENERYMSERYLLERAGYSETAIHPSAANPYILLTKLDGGAQAHYDAYSWATRSMAVVHQYLQEHWREVRSGQVIDVEYILGEKPEPKQSERVTHPV